MRALVVPRPCQHLALFIVSILASLVGVRSCCTVVLDQSAFSLNLCETALTVSGTTI